MCATVAGARVRAAPARADGHFGADAATPCAWLAYAQETAGATEAAGQRVSERTDGKRS